MRAILIASLIVFSACASAKKKWYVKDVAIEHRQWRWCHESKDGPEYHEKGLCYISQKCYKTIFGNERCKRHPLFCAHGDLKCLKKNKWPSVKKGE